MGELVARLPHSFDSSRVEMETDGNAELGVITGRSWCSLQVGEMQNI